MKPKRGGNRGKPAVDARIDARLAEQAVVKAAVAWAADDDEDRVETTAALLAAVEKMQRGGK